MILLLLFAFLLALITIGVPILLVMGVVGLAGILSIDGLNPALFPQKMFAMLDNFSLLALPYFILAGELIARGGISKRLVEFAETAGRPLEGRPRPRVGRLQHGVCRSFRLVGRGHLGNRFDPGAGDEVTRLQAGLRCIPCRLRRHHRRHHPAEHDHDRVRLDDQRLHRRPVSRWHHPRHPDRHRIDDCHQAICVPRSIS